MANYVAYQRDGHLYSVADGRYVAWISDGSVYTVAGKYVGHLSREWVYTLSGDPVGWFVGENFFEHTAGAWDALIG